jgi:lysyl-tRNA synthetase class 2
MIEFTMNEYDVRLKKKWDEDDFSPKNIIKSLKGMLVGSKVSVAGRIVLMRDLGAITFINLYDAEGHIQILLSSKKIDGYKEKLDIGDIIGVEGTLIHSKTGELTLDVDKLYYLTKSLMGLPDKWNGLNDEELKKRLRYIDIISDGRTRDIFVTRHKIIRAIKGFMNDNGFMEVETPILQNIASGAAANPFKTHHDALNLDMYLRIAPELFLKRLVIAGYNKIFEMGRCFRNEGIDKTHLQEFTMMECYQTYISYDKLMDFSISLLQCAAQSVNGSNCVQDLDFTHIPKISFVEFMANIGVRDIFDTNELLNIAKANNLPITNTEHMPLLELVYKKLGVQKVTNPVLVYDYLSCPLAKEGEDKRFSKQFQIIVNKLELVKACLEMVDSQIQEKNFRVQENLEKTGEKDVVRCDYDFIRALEYGMPPTGGLGIGIDRLVKILTGIESIRDIIFFPNLK